MQLSQKQKFIFQFVSAFLKSRLNFQHFQKLDDSQSQCLCEFADSEKRG